MTRRKRAFDLLLALLLAVPVGLAAVIVAAAILIRDGRPVFYGSERMKDPVTPFRLWKFRTMTVTGADSGVSGGDKRSRITATGRILRRARLDELPQLWNILRGDMSFVGPRPPLRQYVERRPDLYRAVLQSRPGVTGLATLAYHRHEEVILNACRSASETDAAYVRRCIPVKARLDLIYQRNATLCYDLKLLWKTGRGFVPRQNRHSLSKKPPIGPA